MVALGYDYGYEYGEPITGPPPAHNPSILMENGDYLLLETGDTILLET